MLDELQIDPYGDERYITVKVHAVWAGDPGHHGTVDRCGELVDPGYPPEPPGIDFEVTENPHALTVSRDVLADRIFEELDRRVEED